MFSQFSTLLKHHASISILAATRSLKAHTRTHHPSSSRIRWVPTLTLIVGFTVALISVNASPLGRVEGSVTDQSNAKVGGARIKLRDNAGVIQYEARSGEDGRFSILNVADGIY